MPWLKFFPGDYMSDLDVDSQAAMRRGPDQTLLFAEHGDPPGTRIPAASLPGWSRAADEDSATPQNWRGEGAVTRPRPELAQAVTRFTEDELQAGVDNARECRTVLH